MNTKKPSVKLLQYSGWLAGWLADWLVEWMGDWYVHCLIITTRHIHISILFDWYMHTLIIINTHVTSNTIVNIMNNHHLDVKLLLSLVWCVWVYG